jgi:hypothetical protein
MIQASIQHESKVDALVPRTQHVNFRIVRERPDVELTCWQTILKLTGWVCGTNPSTFAGGAAPDHDPGDDPARVPREASRLGTACSEPKGVVGHFEKLRVFLKLTHKDPFGAWFVVTGDATPDGMRVVRSVLGAINTSSIVAFRE